MTHSLARLCLILLPLFVQCFYKPICSRSSMTDVIKVTKNPPTRVQKFHKPMHFHRNRVLHVDVFGLGPSEVIIIVGAGLFLYGPDRLKQQLRDSGVKGKIVSAGWRQERAESIKTMIENAENMRKKRKIKRIIDSNTD